jgi:hypothetical protein
MLIFVVALHCEAKPLIEYFRNILILRLYPDEWLFAGPLEEENGMVSYPAELRENMYQSCVKAHSSAYAFPLYSLRPQVWGM